MQRFLCRNLDVQLSAFLRRLTVAVEGFLTHGRLAQFFDHHSNDLFRLLAHLVQEGCIESDRRGWGTCYRFPDTGEQQVMGGGWASHPPLGHETRLKPSPSCPQSGPSSPHSSPHSGSSSPQLNPAIPVIQRQEEEPSLLALAEHVRKGRAREEELRPVILTLCVGRVT